MTERRRQVLEVVKAAESLPDRGESMLWMLGRRRGFWPETYVLYGQLAALVKAGLVERDGHHGGYQFELTADGRAALASPRTDQTKEDR